ncbi:MAG: amidohydrolase family protein [Chloroflexi bacterium]|nr:amidohydrolase family protein [Chloroflexota bacterium]
MRTLIQGGWVVGFDGRSHQLIRDGVLVYEDNTVLEVGSHFDGQVDRTVDARGMLVMPGLINTHLHLGTNAPHTFFLDETKADYFGANFYAYSVPRRGATDSRANARADVEQLYGIWAAIRGGATTILDVGSRNATELVRMVGDVGARVYLGPAFKSYSYVFDEQGRIQWDDDPASGEAGLQRAVAFANEYHGAHNGRVRCMLYPAQLDTCSLDLLKATRRAADESGLRISLHAAMNLIELQRMLRDHGQTSLQLLSDIGFLGEDVLLGHCVFHAHHSWAHYPYVDDLRLLADSGASVAHAPYKYAKMGVMLESLERYRQLGINVALGTDTFPQDLISEMRLAGLMCRFAEGSFRVGRARDVFDAATLGGARALGRDDLGRLCPGARADIVLVDLRSTHFGAVHDPIRSLVDYGSGSDIDTVVVDGRTLISERRAVAVDERALLEKVQESGERTWASVGDWRWNGASVDEIAPMSYPVVTAH